MPPLTCSAPEEGSRTRRRRQGGEVAPPARNASELDPQAERPARLEDLVPDALGRFGVVEGPAERDSVAVSRPPQVDPEVADAVHHPVFRDLVPEANGGR